MSASFLQSLRQSFELNSINCSPDQFHKCGQLFNLAHKWGSKINLTANLDVEMFIQENLLDPILALKAFENSSYCQPLPNPPLKTSQMGPILSLIDIGCGGGFVGIPWVIFASTPISMTLLDRDRRKINFCRQVIRDLRLTRIQTVLGTLQDYCLNSGQHFDACVSRATIGIEGYFQACAPLLQATGLALYFASGPSISDSKAGSALQLEYVIKPADIHRHLALSRASI